MNQRKIEMSDWYLWNRARMVPLIQAKRLPQAHPEEDSCRDGLYYDPLQQKIYRIRKPNAFEVNIEDVLELIDESTDH
jgi:hypothetical protein